MSAPRLKCRAVEGILLSEHCAECCSGFLADMKGVG